MTSTNSDPTRSRQDTDLRCDVPHDMRTTDELLRMFIEHQPGCAVCLIDHADRIISFNSGAERLFGIASAEALGRPIDILVDTETRESAPLAKALEAVRTEGWTSLRGWFRRNTKDQFWGEGSVALARGTQSRSDAFGLLLIDTTHVKQLEVELDEARRRAENLSTAKDRMLAMVSHELRTPMASVLMWSQLINQGGLSSEEVQEGLQAIQRNAEAQARLIEDLVDSVRITSGKLSLKTRDCDIAWIVCEALHSAQPPAGAKGVQLHKDLPGNLAPVVADPDRLRQVIINLISNSIRFTPSGGRICIAVSQSGSETEIRVEDNGSGIPPDIALRLFDPAGLAEHKSFGSHGGLGLGLSITRQLVELHGGKIEAESPNNMGGSTFIVKLPQTAGSN